MDDRPARRLDCDFVLKPTVPEVMPLIRQYYSKSGNGAGGSLHIVLEDGNVDDGNVEFCVKFAKESGDKDGEVLGNILLLMSKTQRMKLYKIGF